MEDELRMAQRGRRYLPLVAILLTVALVVSDWPLDWSFWIDHPFIAALAAGLVLLLLTGSVVDAILRRREARSWVVGCSLISRPDPLECRSSQ